jgi:four helix bundle protein
MENFIGLGLDAGLVNGQKDEGKKPIRSFYDLEVYRNAYKSMLQIFNDIIGKLPQVERTDLVDQLRRSSKAVPRLIAEGHSKRHQNKGFQKYLDDAMAESNETIVSLSQAHDLYGRYINKKLCLQLIKSYTIISKQLYRLSIAWSNFKHRELQVNPKPINQMPDQLPNQTTKNAL